MDEIESVVEELKHWPTNTSQGRSSRSSRATSSRGWRSNMSKPFTIACIPAFNEEGRIGGVVVQVRKYVDRVVVCDDGSVDLTGAIAEGLGAVVIRHGRNLGKGAALRSAFLRARELGADVVVMLDADGQHDPEEIPELVEPILRGEADMVVGSRYVDGCR